MGFEKISFVYPSFVREGMPVATSYRPEMSIRLNNKGGKHVIAITAGFLMQSVGLYLMEVEIECEGQSAIGESTSNGKIETIFMDRVGNHQEMTLTIYTMFSNSVNLDNDGFYHVFVRVYANKDGAKSGEPLDQKECFFFVSHDEDIAK